MGLAGFALAERGAAELAAPDDQRVVEHPALLQVAHQRRRRTFRVLALLLELGEEVAVLVPAGVHQLHEPDAPFEQPAGDQAVVRERAVLQGVGAVARERGLRLVREVDQVGHARLHPEGHLVLGDARVDLGIAIIGEMGRVHRGHVVEQRPPRLAAHARRVGQIRHEVARVPEPDPLEPAGQEPAAPVVVEEELAAGLPLVARGHHDEGRQVGGLAAESVRQPGPHAGPAGDLRTRHEERHAGRMVDGLGVHAPNQADLIGDRPHVRAASRSSRCRTGRTS